LATQELAVWDISQASTMLADEPRNASPVKLGVQKLSPCEGCTVIQVQLLCGHVAAVMKLPQLTSTAMIIQGTDVLPEPLHWRSVSSNGVPTSQPSAEPPHTQSELLAHWSWLESSHAIARLEMAGVRKAKADEAGVQKLIPSATHVQEPLARHVFASM